MSSDLTLICKPLSQITATYGLYAVPVHLVSGCELTNIQLWSDKGHFLATDIQVQWNLTLRSHH